jgi:chromate reductase
MKKKIKVLGIAGSLRKQSYNRGLLQAALEVVPDDCSLEIFELDDIPIYNQDKEMSPPKSVVQLKEKIRAADAILLATPEYNYSIPGVLKNAIDWASRPYGDSAWENKPVAVMGASVGMQGTSRAQYHLRQVFVYLNMHPVNRPELMVPSAQDKFDAQGKLTDPKTRQKITELLNSLIESVEMLVRTEGK